MLLVLYFILIYLRNKQLGITYLYLYFYILILRMKYLSNDINFRINIFRT